MAKFRTDYVTNSSSSSFILGFNSKEEIPEKIAAGFPCYWSKETIQSVISDVENHITDMTAATDLIRQDVEYSNLRIHGKSLWEMNRVERESEEVQKFIQDVINEHSKELEEYGVISIVEYEDHTELGSILEHEIMPQLDCTIRRISNH